MILIHVLFAVATALLLTALFVPFSSRYRSSRGDLVWSGALLFFFLIFVATWAGGIWAAPVGPLFWGVPWIPFIFFGLLFALLIAASQPGNGYRDSIYPPGPEAYARFEQTQEGKPGVRLTREESSSALSALLWAVIVLLFMAILFRYLLFVPY